VNLRKVLSRISILYAEVKELHISVYDMQLLVDEPTYCNNQHIFFPVNPVI